MDTQESAFFSWAAGQNQYESTPPETENEINKDQDDQRGNQSSPMDMGNDWNLWAAGVDDTLNNFANQILDLQSEIQTKGVDKEEDEQIARSHMDQIFDFVNDSVSKRIHQLFERFSDQNV